MDNYNEQKRKQIKKKVNFILEPMLIDILIVKPENPYQFMKEWLEIRREYFKRHVVLTDSKSNNKMKNSEFLKK